MHRFAVKFAFVLALVSSDSFASDGGPVAYGFTPRRTLALVAVASSVFGLVIGGMARGRRRRAPGHSGRRGAIVAFALGLVGLGLGAFVVMTAPGGLGTGGGLAGGVVGVALGVVAIGLSGSGVRWARESPEEIERAARDQHGRRDE